MLQLIGKPYIRQHCIDTFNNEQTVYNYRAFMTGGMAGLAGAKESWTDVVPFQYEPPRKQESAAAIKARIKQGFMGSDGGDAD